MKKRKMLTRSVNPCDYSRCLEIYNWYIGNSTATLEFDPLTPEQFSERIEQIRQTYPVIVCEDEGEIIGYSYLDPFRVRKGYRYTCDLTIYVDRHHRRKGAGRMLMDTVLAAGKAQGLRDVMAVITDENEASLAFHSCMGFREAGHMTGIADKFGRRFGVVYMQRTLQ